jgi:NAD(P)-dependent dehydrogenase (short-subunit alcohol dehydrogenase family)
VTRTASFDDDNDAMTTLITGATDGIGLHTARRCVESGRAVIVHGRDRARVERAVEAVEAHARACGSSARARGLVRDLSTVNGAKALVEDVVRAHGDDLCAVFNNAGVYASTLERTADGRELTFAVNVVAPYVIAGGLMETLVRNAKASGVKSSILNVASISAAPRIDFENIDAERRFSSHGAYSLSKAAMKAMSYEMFDLLEAGRLCGGNASVDDLNVFSCDPGTVNTKMLLAGWGRCGVETYEANDEFIIMCEDIERNGAEHNGAYFVGARPQRRASRVGDEDQARLWRLLEERTGVIYA